MSFVIPNYVSDSGDVFKTRKQNTLCFRKVFNTVMPTGTIVKMIAGSPGYFISSIQVTLSPSVNVSGGGGPFNFYFYDDTAGAVPGFIWMVNFYLPGAFPTVTDVEFKVTTTPPGFFYISPNSGSGLSLLVGSAAGQTIFNGELDILVYYGLTADLA